MRFLETNVFARYLDEPTDETTARWARDCTALFKRVEAGTEEVTTSEVVLSEVFWVMTAKRIRMPRETAAARLRAIISFRGFKMPTKRRCIRALGFVIDDPRLSLVDALVAATVLEDDLVLLSYDTDFDRIDGVRREHP